MSTKVGMDKFRCLFCGAKLDVPRTFTYATCPYCGSTFRIDNPEIKIEHYIFTTSYDKNHAYKLLKEFAQLQVGVVEDFETGASFESAYQYFVPIYIYEINIKAICKEGTEKVEENRIEMDIHGGEEATYVIVPALENITIPIPHDYSFPARGRKYFKPSIIKDGVYLQPTLNPDTIFAKTKDPYLRKTINEAITACGTNYSLMDNSKYIGIAHYPFWLIKYRYKGNIYTSLIDAADGTVIYLEYPISLKSRVIGIVGGIMITLIAALIGGIVSALVVSNIVLGLLGGALASLPSLSLAILKFIKYKGIYRYKPSEEAIFAPIR